MSIFFFDLDPVIFTNLHGNGLMLAAEAHDVGHDEMSRLMPGLF